MNDRLDEHRKLLCDAAPFVDGVDNPVAVAERDLALSRLPDLFTHRPAWESGWDSAAILYGRELRRCAEEIERQRRAQLESEVEFAAAAVDREDATHADASAELALLRRFRDALVELSRYEETWWLSRHCCDHCGVCGGTEVKVAGDYLIDHEPDCPALAIDELAKEVCDVEIK